MKSGTVRKILLLAAGSVFLFSGWMVSKYHLELRAGAEYAQNMAQSMVTYVEAPAGKAADEPGSEAVYGVQTQIPDAAMADVSNILSLQGAETAAPASLAQPAAEPAGAASAQTVQAGAGEPAEGVPASIPETDHSLYSADAPLPAAEEDAPGPALAPDQTKSEGTGGAPARDGEEDACAPVRVAPIQVDFQALREKNGDVVAWLYCPDTPINYPVVQAEDNDYYMHRLLDGRKSYPGTLFMDFRNADDFSDWNSVIYGHNMRNGSMFGTLQHYKNRPYLESHSEIYLLTPECNYVIDVLAGFVTPNDSELYNALHPEDGEKEGLLKAWLKDAGLAPQDYPAPEARLVTLSTCSYEYKNARYVLIGALQEIGI